MRNRCSIRLTHSSMTLRAFWMSAPTKRNILATRSLPIAWKTFSIQRTSASSSPSEAIQSERSGSIGSMDFASVWDSSAIVSPLAKVGKGCFIGKMAIVNAGVEIGDNVVINTMALVEHGSSVENHANISTKAVLNGDVLIGEGTFVGSGSVVIGQLSVGSWSIVGAGAVVTKDVESGVTVAGVPARVVRREARFW